MTPKPQSPRPREPREIPALSPLIGEKHWCVWRWEWVEKKSGEGKWTKPPYRPTGRKAANNDPKTWASFEECWRVVQAGKADGIGFMLMGLPGEKLAAIDIDKVRDAESGALLPWAEALVERANSYTEITPSLCGLRILGTAPGLLPIHRKIAHPEARDSSFELYADCARFITISGHVNGHDAFGDIGAVMRELEALGGESNGHAQHEFDDRDDVEGEGDAEAIELEGLPLPIVELIVHGTLDGKPIKKRGPAFARVVRALRGHGFAAVLATLRAYPNGIQAKFKGRLETELRRIWQKIESATQISPAAPYDVAAVLRDARFRSGDNPTLFHNQGTWHAWSGRAYPALEDAAIRSGVYRFLAGCVDAELCSIKPNTTLVNHVLDALKAVCHLDAASPAWLGPEIVPVSEVVACANGLLHLPTGRLLPHSPEFFNVNALDIAFDGHAPQPSEWLRFLGQLWPDDQESIAALQEIFGYCLSPDTSQQKAFIIVGPKRSGKGTIARVLRRLIGPDNAAGPTLAALGRQFGLQSLIDKRLAIISDARLGKQTDPAVVAERLLSITGEDAIDVDRKNKIAWTGQLQVRFVVLTNELPRLSDASGALASRFIMLVMSQSFYGREDLRLTAKLLPELPGILNWAIAGWHRLRQRGHFVQPESAQDAVSTMEDLGSPISAFVREECELGGYEVDRDALFGAWTSWCGEEGMRPGTKAGFGKQLHAALPGLKTRRPRTRDDRTRTYVGIRLRQETADERAIGAALKWYSPERGFGFVTLDDGQDALLPSRVVGDASIVEGQRLKVTVTKDAKGLRVRAIVEVEEWVAM